MILNDAEMNANVYDQNPTLDENQQINVAVNPNQLVGFVVAAGDIVVGLKAAVVVAASYKDKIVVVAVKVVVVVAAVVGTAEAIVDIKPN